MKKLNLLLLAAVLLISSCSYGNYMLHFNGSQVDDRAETITTLSPSTLPSNPGSKYSFLIIADSHFGSSRMNKHVDRFITKFPQLFDGKSDEEKPQFIVNLGDIMDSGLQSEADEYLKLENELKSIAKEKLGLSAASDYMSFAILGNHDLYAEDGWDVWKKNFYPATEYQTSYFRFTLGAFSYYFLDTANGTLGNAQLEDLEERLATDSNPKLIIMHYPIAPTNISFSLQNTLERSRLLYAFAKSDVKIVFSGHYHPGNFKDYGNFTERTVKSFGDKEIALLVHVDETERKITYEEIDFSD